MNVLSWFKSHSKKNVVLPSDYAKDQLHGLELIRAFTTDTEPKIKDFPKSQYKVYWETQVESVPGSGYCGAVRMYSYQTGKIVKEQYFTAPMIPQLKVLVDEFIHIVLAENKR